MSVVVFAKDGMDIVGASDARVIAGYRIVSSDEKKLILNGDFLFGYTGEPRIGSILKYDIDLTVDETNVKKALRSDIVPSIHEVIKDSYSGEDRPNYDLLIGYKGEIVTMDAFGSMTFLNKWGCIGSGEEVATGMMTLVYPPADDDMEGLLCEVIEGVCKYINTCGPPVFTERLKR